MTHVDLRRLNRMYQVLTACNTSLVSATSETALFDSVCKHLIGIGGYRLAWVGLTEDDAACTVRPVAQAGHDDGYLESARLCWADTEYGQGPTGTAIRERRPVLARDLQSDPHYAPWCEAALRHGHASSIALPLMRDDSVCLGALNIYAAEADAFDADEVQLLSELASNLAHGIQALRDRAARAQAQQALQVTAQRLKHLSEASPTIVYSLQFCEGASCHNAVSENVARILGYAPDEAVQPQWWRAGLHPEDREAAIAANERVLTREHVVHEYRFAHRDGHYLWVRDELRLIRDNADRPAEAVGAWTDITERKRIEQRLERERNFLKTLIGTLPDLVWLKDPQGTYLLCNPRFERLIGATEAAIRGKTDYDFVDRERADVFCDRDRATMAAGRPMVNEREVTFANDGHRELVEVIKTPMYDAVGQIIGVLGIARDVTEKKQSEQALRESEVRYRALFEHLQSGFALHEIVTDDAGKPVDYIILAANDAYGRMTGLEPARIVGKRVTEFYPEVATDSTDWIGLFGEVALTGRTIHLERFAEGLQRWYDTIAYRPAARQFAVVVQDITERKLAEAAVSESETRHRTVLAALGEGVYGVDRDGRCTFINRAAAAMLGLAEEDVLGQDQHALFHHHRADGQPYPPAECPIHKTVRDGQVRRQEEWFFRPDGTGFPVELVATSLAEGGGAVVAFRDISARRRAEDDLRKLSLAVEQSPESIVITDLDARIEYVNEAFLRNTGYLRDELIGQNPRVLHSGRTPAATFQDLWATLTQGRPWEGEFFNRRKDGSEYVEFARVAPIRQPDGRITHYVAVKEDVTEHKAAEATIEQDREQQRTLRELLENTLGDGSLEETMECCLTQVMNVSWLSILPKGGIFLSEEDGKSLRLVVSHDLSPQIRKLCAQLPLGCCHCGQAAETGRMQYAECVDGRHVITYPGIKDHGHYSLPLVSHGKVLGVMVLYLPIGFQPSPGKEQFLASVAGILAGLISRKRAEANLVEHQAHLEDLVATRTASLEQMRHDAETANRAKSAFLAAMSHEIRTPMNGVLGMIDLLGQSELNADQHDMTQTAGESARSLLAIIDDILDFSKIEAGKLDLDVVPVSIAQVVEGVGEALAQIALKKNVELLLFCDPGIPQWVSADPVRLRQILFNLAGNAVKFTGREDGKAGKVFIRADLMESAGNRVHVCLRVIDNGIGMSAQAVQTLFKPFTQAESSTTRRFGGTGLGLSISLRLANLMGGSIEVNSIPGQGSTFGVALDFEVAQGAPAADRAFDLDKLAIVVVAPGEDMQEILVRYLGHSGAQVLAAQQPDDAVRHADAAMRMGTPWVVVADAGTGESVAAALRTRFREAPELAGTRFVMIERGRRRTARAQESDCVSIDADALRRSALLRAVAIAAGRASPERRGNEATELLPPSPVPSIDEAQGAGRLILVAEDNRTNQKVIERQLHLLGYAVEIAADGQEALAMSRRRRYGLVLTDCHMPNMDGFELTAALRREQGGARTPIIAITANALKGEDQRCLAAGMDDYLSKPVQLVALRDALEKWLPTGAASRPPAEPATTSAEAQPSAAPVNPDALKEIVGDDPDVLAEFLSDFVLTAREAVTELRLPTLSTATMKSAPSPTN